jgi:hypothetical protein
MTPSSAQTLTKILLILAGIALLIVAGVVAGSVRRFARIASAADGVVARLNAGGSHPQIEFTTASGQKVSYPQGGLTFGHRAGDKVRVLYEAGDPERTARLATFGAMWAVPMILLLIAASLIAGALSIKPAVRIPALY